MAAYQWNREPVVQLMLAVEVLAMMTQGVAQNYSTHVQMEGAQVMGFYIA